MVTAQGRAWPSAHPTRLHHPHGQCRECREPLLKAWLISLLLRHCDPMDCNPSGTSVHGDSPGKNTGVGYHALLQGIFPTQGWNPGLPHCRLIVYRPGLVLSTSWEDFLEVQKPCKGNASEWSFPWSGICSFFITEEFFWFLSLTTSAPFFGSSLSGIPGIHTLDALCLSCSSTSF